MSDAGNRFPAAGPQNALGEPVRAALPQIPDGIRSLPDYARHAMAHIEDSAWAHIESGADQGLTLAHNRTAFDRLQLCPESLCDLTQASTQQTLLAQVLRWPVMLAPVAYHRLAHPEGELATARAAMAMQTGFIVSTLSSYSLEETMDAAKTATQEVGRSAPMWFQLYKQTERSHCLRLVRRAEDAGYQAIVWTVDAGIKRSGFALPPGVVAANLRDFPPQPLHVSDLMRDSILFGSALADNAPSWDDLQWLRQQTRLPLIIKGVLSARSARAMVEMGADALIVSNHGGRVLDGTVSPVDALPVIRSAVGPETPLLLDGGVRYGTDVFKALALGANAVLIGRPQLYSLAVAGMLGTAHMLHVLRTEVELAMAQMGCARLADIQDTLLFKAAHR